MANIVIAPTISTGTPPYKVTVRTFSSNEEPALPPTQEMIQNAAEAASRIASAAITGQKIMCSEEDFNARVAICKACEFFRPNDERCSKCGCWVLTAVTGKARFKTEHCPLMPPKW